MYFHTIISNIVSFRNGNFAATFIFFFVENNFRKVGCQLLLLLPTCYISKGIIMPDAFI